MYASIVARTKKPDWNNYVPDICQIEIRDMSIARIEIDSNGTISQFRGVELTNVFTKATFFKCDIQPGKYGKSFAKESIDLPAEIA